MEESPRETVNPSKLIMEELSELDSEPVLSSRQALGITAIVGIVIVGFVLGMFYCSVIVLQRKAYREGFEAGRDEVLKLVRQYPAGVITVTNKP